jgi:hypothetical protein
MVYTVDMGLGAMLYVPNFIKIGSSIQKLLRGDTHRNRHTNSKFLRKAALFFFFQNKESKLKIFSYLTENTPYPLENQLIDSVYENNILFRLLSSGI